MVTAPELAKRLRVDPKTLRAWLRKKARAGHPLLMGHAHGGNWVFSEEVAGQLEKEYRGVSREAKVSAAAAAPPAPPNQEPGSSSSAAHRVIETWLGEEVETLEDLLRPGLRAVCVGINPSLVSVAAGHYYQGQLGQKFYERLRKVGLIGESERGHEDDAAFEADIGFTDIVKKPSARANELTPEDFDHGREILAQKLEKYQPGLVIFTFKKSAVELCGDFAGHGFVDGISVAGIDAFVMPGPYERAERVEGALNSLRRFLAR